MNLRRAVFFAAHTDDEMICAGTLHRLVREGCLVSVVVFCQCGEKGDPLGEKISDRVDDEFRDSMRIIGSMTSACLNIVPESRLGDREQDVANFVHEFVTDLKPDLVISLSPDDDNHAHAVVGTQVRRITRGRVPVLVECHFPWNHCTSPRSLYVTLSEEDVEAKRRVIQAYKSQHWRYEYEKILMGESIAQGESVKVRHAERFELVRAVL